MTYQFEWDPSKAKTNLQKHEVDFHQATNIFRDPSQITIYDEEHSTDEDRYVTIGFDGHSIVLVVHTFQKLNEELFLVRIISAREAKEHEISQYRKGII